MNVRPLSPALGAEVSGVSLAAPVNDSQREAFRQIFLEHSLLVVRDQQLTPGQLVAFARTFGEIEPYEHLSEFLMEGQPEVIVLSNIKKNGRPIGVQDAGQYWHTDRSYVKTPAWSSVLHARQVPMGDNGEPLGDTEFASMTKAFDDLPPDEQQRLRSLIAVHEYVYRFSKNDGKLQAVEHPLVLEHPITRTPGIFVNAGFTKTVAGLDDARARELLERLYAHVTQDKYVYRHQWRVGDVLMWDNYSTQHRATGGYGERPRLMWRTTIQGFALN